MPDAAATSAAGAGAATETALALRPETGPLPRRGRRRSNAEDVNSTIAAANALFRRLDAVNTGFIHEDQVQWLWPTLTQHLEGAAQNFSAQRQERGTQVSLLEWQSLMSAVCSVVGSRRLKSSLRRADVIVSKGQMTSRAFTPLRSSSMTLPLYANFCDLKPTSASVAPTSPSHSPVRAEQGYYHQTKKKTSTDRQSVVDSERANEVKEVQTQVSTTTPIVQGPEATNDAGPQDSERANEVHDVQTQASTAALIVQRPEATNDAGPQDSERAHEVNDVQTQVTEVSIAAPITQQPEAKNDAGPQDSGQAHEVKDGQTQVSPAAPIVQRPEATNDTGPQDSERANEVKDVQTQVSIATPIVQQPEATNDVGPQDSEQAHEVKDGQTQVSIAAPITQQPEAKNDAGPQVSAVADEPVVAVNEVPEAPREEQEVPEIEHEGPRTVDESVTSTAVVAVAPSKGDEKTDLASRNVTVAVAEPEGPSKDEIEAAPSSPVLSPLSPVEAAEAETKKKSLTGPESVVDSERAHEVKDVQTQVSIATPIAQRPEATNDAGPQVSAVADAPVVVVNEVPEAPREEVPENQEPEGRRTEESVTSTAIVAVAPSKGDEKKELASRNVTVTVEEPEGPREEEIEVAPSSSVLSTLSPVEAAEAEAFHRRFQQLRQKSPLPKMAKKKGSKVYQTGLTDPMEEDLGRKHEVMGVQTHVMTMAAQEERPNSTPRNDLLEGGRKQSWVHDGPALHFDDQVAIEEPEPPIITVAHADAGNATDVVALPDARGTAKREREETPGQEVAGRKAKQSSSVHLPPISRAATAPGNLGDENEDLKSILESSNVKALKDRLRSEMTLHEQTRNHAKALEKRLQQATKPRAASRPRFGITSTAPYAQKAREKRSVALPPLKPLKSSQSSRSPKRSADGALRSVHEMLKEENLSSMSRGGQSRTRLQAYGRLTRAGLSTWDVRLDEKISRFQDMRAFSDSMWNSFHDWNTQYHSVG